jgi:hypothetical protein
MAESQAEDPSLVVEQRMSEVAHLPIHDVNKRLGRNNKQRELTGRPQSGSKSAEVPPQLLYPVCDTSEFRLTVMNISP